MLKSLSIKNIALIENCEIEFASGLNVLSGETGAGKSIILDSLNFVLGKRADKNLIRYGADMASVCGVFESKNKALDTIFDDFGIEKTNNEIIINRIMKADGSGVARVNGVKVTQSMLKSITSCIVDIYGQHETTELLDETRHLSILDSFAEEEIAKCTADFASIHNNLRQVLSKLAQYGSGKTLAKNIDILEYQIKEIENATLIEDEEDKLLETRKKMNNVEGILQNSSAISELLNGNEAEINVLAALSMAQKYLRQIEDFDSDFADCAERIESCKIELRDVCDTVSAVAQSIDFDEETARWTETRLEQIRTLKKKYGSDIAEVLAYLDKIKSEYDFYINGEEIVRTLEAEAQQLRQNLYKAGLELSNKRKASALALEKKVVKELAQLGMKDCNFSTKFSSKFVNSDCIEKCGLSGLDEVEFLISTNAGQPLKSLAKTISGGELSRFVLALKNIIANLDGVTTMVFDEIDTGISGKIAQIVAEKLYSISVDKQVLSVTHLPNLASMADVHFLISKYSQNNQTYTKVENLNSEETIKEIARLIGGAEVSGFAEPHARQMKTYANSFKAQIHAISLTSNKK